MGSDKKYPSPKKIKIGSIFISIPPPSSIRVVAKIARVSSEGAHYPFIPPTKLE